MKAVKTVALVSLSSGIMGEPFVRFEVEIGLRRLKEYGLEVRFMPHALKGADYCQICSDHPRFRNYWSDREEMGLGLACEEAARIILASPSPLRLIPLGEDEEEEETPSEEELALRRYRDRLIASVRETGPLARLREYLLYRHLADALYDGRVEERIRFTDLAFHQITAGWDGDLETLIERARSFSNEVEYDDEKLESMIGGLSE